MLVRRAFYCSRETLIKSGSAIESAFPSMLPVQSPVTDYRSPVFLDLVIQLDKTLFHGEVIRGGGLDSVKEDTAMGVGDGDEDMLTPDEAIRRQGAEIFRERAAMCRKSIGDGVRIHEALIARAVFFLNGEISESTHCCAVTVGVTGMKLVVVPAEDDRLAGAAVKIIDNDGMVEVVEILFKTIHFHLLDLDGIARDIEKLAAQEEAFSELGDLLHLQPEILIIDGIGDGVGLVGIVDMGEQTRDFFTDRALRHIEADFTVTWCGCTDGSKYVLVGWGGEAEIELAILHGLYDRE